MEHNRIKELREDRDIKQREIAAYLKVAQNTYSNMKRCAWNFVEILILFLVSIRSIWNICLTD